jgi:NAD(P)-dependent dehydrogenase (short-subunit alcohol dehydrogenase family)
MPGQSAEMPRLPKLFDLSGRVAIVTGASSGLGAGFARTLAAAGATVVAAARRRDLLEKLAAEVAGTAGAGAAADGKGAVVPVECDVTRPLDRRRLIDRALEINGGIDVLVNNAGRPGPPNAADDGPEVFAGILDLNLAAGFHLAAAVVAARPPGRRCSIINVSSVVGLVSTAPIGGASYAASKAGILGLTRELAGQWGRSGVRVNAVVPGWFDTEMTEGLFTHERSATWVRRNTMLNRGGQEGEVDGAVLFLAGDAASYVTGHALVVDGGWTAR